MTTKIEWTDETWNPIRARNLETGRVGHFCVHKSPGCVNCYSEIWQARFGNPIRFAEQDHGKVEVFLDEDLLHKPLGWRKPRKVFVCSMTDLFLEHHPYHWLVDIWTNMGLARRHQFQVLTKRPEMMRTFLGHPKTVEAIRDQYESVAAGVPVEPWEWPLPNVWVGTSIEDRKRLARLDDLRPCEAPVRFLSLEPLLEDLGEIDLTGISWVIVGGESGNQARPMHPDWARSIRNQCTAANVPFLFKQWGSWADEDNPIVISSDHGTFSQAVCKKGSQQFIVRGDGNAFDTHMYFTGKGKAGRTLDGKIWDEMPA